MSGHHIVRLRVYYLIFFSLMALTATTIFAARVDLGALNIVVAMGIAGLKATLVVLFFMHVKYSHRLTWVFVGAGIFWLVLLITLTTADYVSRGW